MLQKRKSTRSVIRYAIITPILLLCIGFSSLAQENLPKDEQALLEKYKKEINENAEKRDFSDVPIYFKDKEDYNKGVILTKDSFYRMKAFVAIISENADKSYDINKFMDFSIIDKSYQTYIDEVNSTKKIKKEIEIIEEAPFKSIVDVVPFASVDRSPVFPGCDENMSEEDLKKCLTEKISQHVSANFDIEKAKQLGVEGVNRVYIRFRITDKGMVTDVQSRSSHPKLSEVGENTILSLPKMKPGMNKDKAVNVIYTLPITFTVPENELEKK